MLVQGDVERGHSNFIARRGRHGHGFERNGSLLGPCLDVDCLWRGRVRRLVIWVDSHDGFAGKKRNERKRVEKEEGGAKRASICEFVTKSRDSMTRGRGGWSGGRDIESRHDRAAAVSAINQSAFGLLPRTSVIGPPS